MKIKEVMRPVRTIAPNSNIKEAAKLMTKYSIGSLVVVEEDKKNPHSKKVLGILTERDVLMKVVAEGKSSEKVSVEEIMTFKLITISPDAYIDDAVFLMMQHKIKKLPVLDGDTLVGIITSTDIVANSEDVGEFYLLE